MITWEDFTWAIRLILALEYVMHHGYPGFEEIETYISSVVYGKPKTGKDGVEIPHPRCTGLCREVVEEYIRKGCKREVVEEYIRKEWKNHDPQAEQDKIEKQADEYLVVITKCLIKMLIDRIVAYFIPQKEEFNGHNFLDSQWQSRPELFLPPYLAHWQKVQKPARKCPYCHICLDSDNSKQHFLSSTCVYKCLEDIKQKFGHMESIQHKLNQLQVVKKGLKESNKTLPQSEQQPSTRPSFGVVSEKLFDVWF
jgi:hypothetical protein